MPIVETIGTAHSTGLETASTYGHNEIVQIILQKGVNVNEEYDYGMVLKEGYSRRHRNVV